MLPNAGRSATPPAPTDPVRIAAALLVAALIIAALHYGRDVLVPLVIAGFLAFVLAPLARLLQRSRLPRGPAVMLSVAVAFLGVLAVGWTIASQASDLAGALPGYLAVIRTKFGALSGLGDLLRQADSLVRGGMPSEGAVVVAQARRETPLLDLLGSLAGPLLGPLATTGLVAIFTILVLLFRDDLRDRVVRLAGARDLPRTMAAMNDAAERLSRFFLAQVALNAGYALVIAGALWAIGLPSPLLWGILAGLMRFVPFIGTPVAITPPLILALAVSPGWAVAILVLALFLLGGLLMGQVFEPLVFGSRTGLSPISVVLAASFWALLWGPVGLLIATPLTVGLVVLGRHVPQLEFLDIVLGDRPALLPEETFYQRAMEGDADALVAHAREVIGKGGTFAGYADGVALRGLAFAQADWSREAFEADRLEAIRTGVGVLLDDLAELEAAEPSTGSRPDWGSDGTVLCLPARGRLDDLTARVAAMALQRTGFGAVAETSAALEAANLARLDPTRVRLCCLSVLEDGNSVAGVRTFLRRLARQLPETRVIVGLWHAPPDSPMLEALRQEGPAEAIVTTVGEAVAMCEALAAHAVPVDGVRR